MVETRTLPSKTIKYRFARGKNPEGVRLNILKSNIGGDEGSRLDLFALNVTTLEGLKYIFQAFKAPHSAHRSPNP